MTLFPIVVAERSFAIVLADPSVKQATKQVVSSSSKYTEHLRKHTPLISNASDEDSWYVAIIRRRLTSNDVLPPLETCGSASVFRRLNENYVAHHQPSAKQHNSNEQYGLCVKGG
jgi:hypothetical protein